MHTQKSQTTTRNPRVMKPNKKQTHVDVCASLSQPQRPGELEIGGTSAYNIYGRMSGVINCLWTPMKSYTVHTHLRTCLVWISIALGHGVVQVRDPIQWVQEWNIAHEGCTLSRRLINRHSLWKYGVEWYWDNVESDCLDQWWREWKWRKFNAVRYGGGRW